MTSLREVSRKYGSFLALVALIVSATALFIGKVEPFTAVVISLVASFVVYLLSWCAFAIFGEVAERLEDEESRTKDISVQRQEPVVVPAKVLPKREPAEKTEEPLSVLPEPEIIETGVEKEENALEGEPAEDQVGEVLKTLIARAEKEKSEEAPAEDGFVEVTEKD